MDLVVVLMITVSHIVAFVLGYSLRAYISGLHRSYR